MVHDANPGGVGSPEPPRACQLCARLVRFRAENEREYPTWHNGAVPSFGDADAKLLVLGLAPGLKGANRTGRPFTGDYAGNLLFPTLIEFGFATGEYRASPDDSLRLRACMISNAVRCVPPQNKPTPEEIRTCRAYLAARLATLPKLVTVVALGRIAHDSLLTALGARKSEFPFAHGRRHTLRDAQDRPLTLFDSYHCSRYNTNTGRLTAEMFRAVFADVRAVL